LLIPSAATISGTNTGDQTTITGNSGTTTAALGLKTATGTVALSTATAPSSGQVLTATSSTAANWQTPAATGVTSVTGTGTVNGLTLTGTVTSTGNLTLGGTLTGTASININGTVGATTPNTGAFSSVVINGATLSAEIPNFATTASTSNYLGVKTTGTGATMAAGIFMENSTAHGLLYKAATGYGTYKNITSNDLGFYNNNIGGNISILNDHTSGNINFAAGGSSTAHLTIASTGVVNVANLTTNGVVTATSGNGTLATVAPGTNGNVLTSNGTTWTSTAPATTNPAGSGSELQFRSSGSAFGAVTGSTVSGSNVTFGGTTTIALGTITDPVTGLSLTATWNDAADTFIGVDTNITNTNSAAASRLERWRVGGTELAAVARLGGFLATSNGSTTPAYGSASNTDFGIYFESSRLMVREATNAIAGFGDLGASTIGLIMGSTRPIGWSATTPDGTYDTAMVRDGASGKLAIRSGTTAQEVRIYDTYTSASDYHRLGMATVRISQTATAGATITLTGLIPDGAVVMGVTTKVTTALTGGVTGYQIGTAADADRWGVAATATIGTTTDNRDWTNGTIECFTAATDVILTANGANFSGTGVIYVSIQYLRGESD
jgi:hypothetical protein